MIVDSIGKAHRVVNEPETRYRLDTELDPQQISAVTYARDVGIPEDVIIRMLDERADSQSIRNAATFYTFNHGR